MSFKSIIEFNLKHRWAVIAFFLIITLLAATQLPKLRFDFSPEAMLEFSQEEIDFQKQFDEKFSNNTNLFLVVFSVQDSILTPDALAALRNLTDDIANEEDVVKVYSLAKVPDAANAGFGSLLSGNVDTLIPNGDITPDILSNISEQIDNSPIIQGNLISKNGKHALIMVSISPQKAEPADFYPVYEKIDKRIQEWQQIQSNRQYKIDYGGLPYIRALTVNTMKSEQFILWPVVGILYIIALCLVFRSFWQAILPLVCIGCVIVWAIAIMVLADMPVTMINNTLPLLILVIGVTNGMYIVTRILDERRKGKNKNKAIVDGVYRVSMASFLTTLTTSIGFGSLIIAKTNILNSFGAITALAVILIYVTIIFMMPQVASLNSLNAHTKSSDEPRDGIIERCMAKLTSFSVNHHRVLIAAAIVLLGASAAIASTIRFDSRVNDVFQDDHPVTATNRLIEEQLGGILPVELDLWMNDTNAMRKSENLFKVCALQNTIKKDSGIISAISLCDMTEASGIDWSAQEPPQQAALAGALIGIHRIQPDMFNNYMAAQGNNVHITFRIPDNGYENAKATIARIRKAAESALQGTDINFRLTGIGYNSTLGLDHFMSDLFWSLVTAFMIIFAVLFISFRSFWSGFVAILPNVIPIMMTMAFLPLYGFNLNTTSVLVFTISIGLSVDNSIHIIQRYRQEYRGGRTVREALTVAMTSSGRAILQSNTLLCGGLLVLLFSDFDPVRRVGALTVTTIFAALVVSLLLLPAEIICIGHKMRLPRFKNPKDSQPAGALAFPAQHDISIPSTESAADIEQNGVNQTDAHSDACDQIQNNSDNNPDTHQDTVDQIISEQK